MEKIGFLVTISLLIVLNPSNAQDEVLVLDDVQFDGDFTFDDDLFGDAFDESSSANTNSWLDDFTIKISQQFSGQINNHGVETVSYTHLTLPTIYSV